MADNTIETDIVLTGKDNGATDLFDKVSAATKRLQATTSIVDKTTAATKKLTESLQKTAQTAPQVEAALKETFDPAPISEADQRIAAIQSRLKEISGGAGGMRGLFDLGATCGYATPNGTTVQIPAGQSTVTFPSTTPLAGNQPFFVSLMIFGASNILSQSCDVRMQFGAWRLINYNGQFYIGYINDNWNLSSETSGLYNQDVSIQGPRVIQDDGSFLNEDAIYDVFARVNVNTDTQTPAAGAYYYLWIIPQPGYGLYVATGQSPFSLSVGKKGNNIQAVALPDWINSDTVYPAGSINVRAQSTNFTISGYPLKFNSTVMMTGPFSNGAINQLVGDLSWNKQSVEPAGTSIQIQELSSGYSSFLIPIEMNAGGGMTPFLYWMSASNPGGTFGNITANQYDSNIDIDPQGRTPVKDVTVSCDGDMRRHQYEVSLKLANKTVAQLTEKSALLENQIADLSLGLSMDSLSPIITGGMITPCGAFNARKMTDDGMGEWTEIRATVCDKWKIAEDAILEKIMPGDGLILGDYITYVLGVIGFSEAEVAIEPNTGSALPTAKYGDPPCVIARDQQTGADWLRELMDCYGFDLNLYVGSDGKWYLWGTPSSLATVSGVAAEFSSSRSRHNALSYPGRLAILGTTGPDWLRDSSDFYNAIQVKGAVIGGNQLYYSYIDKRSIYDPTAPNFIGRFKPYPTVVNENLRDINHVIAVGRSMAMRYAISNRMYQIESYFHIDLFTNDKITVDGKECRIKRLSGGFLSEDRMSIVVQEIQP